MSTGVARVEPYPQAAIGFRAHSGWAALVALSLDGDKPQILARGRPHLVEKFTYEFRQPYHTAEKLPLEKAASFISRVEAEAQRLARQAIQRWQTDLRKQGYDLTHYALILASARPLPPLEKILSSHALIHTADGQLFRRALAAASGRCHLNEFAIEDNELIDAGCKAFGVTPDNLITQLASLGRSLGSPWAQDEKYAALAAWLALTSRRSVKS